MTGWQPIETAPKNTPVLICFEDGQREVARWSVNDHGEDLGWWSNDGLDFNYGQDKPLYWAPLLPAPDRLPSAEIWHINGGVYYVYKSSDGYVSWFCAGPINPLRG